MYTGFESATYTSFSSVPWNTYKTDITSVIVENMISPVSTAYWFYGLNNCSYLDVENLNTSMTLDMSYTFYKTGYDVSSFNIIGLDSWNVSSVTKMSYMFDSAGYSATYTLDLSGWNVSSVTSYSNFNAGVESKVIAPTWVN